MVEKFGYGFSDVVDEQRDIDTMLSETRMALEKAGIEGPYVLCPHYVHDYEYEKISEEIRNLLKKMY